MGLDVELEWPGTRAGETGSNGHVLLLPPKACLRDQPVWTRGKVAARRIDARRGEVNTM